MPSDIRNTNMAAHVNCSRIRFIYCREITNNISGDALMENHNLFKLTEHEKMMKTFYLSSGRKILTSPLNFDQYGQLMEEHPEFPDVREFYRTTTSSGYGMTLDKQGVFADRDGVDMNLNGRYSYPLIHNHTFFEIVYVYSGSCINYIENTSIEMKQGDFCFLAPDTMHTIVSVSDDDVIMNLILNRENFERFFLEMLRERNLLSDFFKRVLYDKAVSPFIIFPTGDDARIRAIWLAMYQERIGGKYAYEECIVLYARLLFLYLIRSYEMMAVVPGYASAKTDHHIVAMLGYIATNYNHVTLHGLSEFFCYNESYVSRMLKTHTGRTFNEIVNDLRLEHAKEMLENTDKTIGEISQEVGCFDSSHLSKKFRSKYGASPKEYRNEIKSGKKYT